MLRVEGWKALTFRTLKSLLLGTDGEFYYSLGKPVLNPPKLRGSCLVRFSGHFVDETVAACSWWSIPDSGALDAGFASESIASSPSLAWRNSGDTLAHYLSAAKQDVGLNRALTRRTPIDSMLAQTLGHAGIAVPSATEMNARWWFYEVVVEKWEGCLSDAHVVALYVPRTLRPYVREEFPSLDPKKLQNLNPFLGMESLAEGPA
jgi:hypothetical protein